MFMGINGTEMVILVVVALVVIGPKRLPEYAQKLRELVRQMRRMAEGAKDSVQRDFGDDFKDVDWQKLDPRQYDPRRIVREALVEEDVAIRESKRRERSSLESSTTSDEADDQAASASALPLLSEARPQPSVRSPRSNASRHRPSCGIAPPRRPSTRKPPDSPSRRRPELSIPGHLEPSSRGYSESAYSGVSGCSAPCRRLSSCAPRGVRGSSRARSSIRGRSRTRLSPT
jgi:sec-independent protein translocase protein TatB